jgi:hypothetical protein
MIRWITQKEANQFVIDHHRHHGKVVGSIFQLGLYEGETLIAVAIAGRPNARVIDFRRVIEVTRLCSIGVENSCSQFYAACARIAKEMGFEKIITYTLESESGTSLKASGWLKEAEGVGGLNWSVPSRPREIETVSLFGTVTKYPAEMKVRWSKAF